MSQKNFEVMVDLGYSGDQTDTCFVAALDCLLEDVDIPIHIYLEYDQAFNDQESNGFRQERSSMLFRKVMEIAVGEANLDRIITLPVKEKEELVLLLDSLRGKYHIIIVVSEKHDVGLKPVGTNQWIMVGTGLPTEEILNSCDVYQYLYPPPVTDKYRPLNIYLIK